MNVQFTEKIENIFKSTLLLIKDHGFHGTPMSQIAKHANVAIGTIYHYFPSKENLILELFYYSKQKIFQSIFENLDETLPYQQQFALVFKGFCKFYMEEVATFSFLEQFYSSPFSEQVRNDLNKTCKVDDMLTDFLLRGIQNKDLQNLNIQVLSSAYIGSAVTFSKSIIYGKIEFNKKNLDDLINIIWNGVKSI